MADFWSAIGAVTGAVARWAVRRREGSDTIGPKMTRTII